MPVTLAPVGAVLGPLPAVAWAQYLSGVLGLLVVLAAVVVELRGRPVRRPAHRRALPAPLLPLVVAAAVVYGASAGLAAYGGGLHDVAFDGVVRGTVAAVVGTGATCLLWLAASRLRASRG